MEIQVKWVLVNMELHTVLQFNNISIMYLVFPVGYIVAICALFLSNNKSTEKNNDIER